MVLPSQHSLKLLPAHVPVNPWREHKLISSLICSGYRQINKYSQAAGRFDCFSYQLYKISDTVSYTHIWFCGLFGGFLDGFSDSFDISWDCSFGGIQLVLGWVGSFLEMPHASCFSICSSQVASVGLLTVWHPRIRLFIPHLASRMKVAVTKSQRLGLDLIQWYCHPNFKTHSDLQPPLVH